MKLKHIAKVKIVDNLQMSGNGHLSESWVIEDIECTVGWAVGLHWTVRLSCEWFALNETVFTHILDCIVWYCCNCFHLQFLFVCLFICFVLMKKPSWHVFACCWDRVLAYSLGWSRVHCVAQADLKHTVFLPLLLRCWDCSHTLSCLVIEVYCTKCKVYPFKFVP